MYLSKDPGSWQQYVRRADNIGVPLNELAKKYAMESNLYVQQMIMEAQMLQQQQTALATASGGNAPTVTISNLPSNCIEMVFNTTDGGGNSTVDFTTSAPTNFTLTWGDGETLTDTADGAYTASHTYAEQNVSYTARLCFDDISLVTILDIQGD